jgi:hypothetical protein
LRSIHSLITYYRSMLKKHASQEHGVQKYVISETSKCVPSAEICIALLFKYSQIWDIMPETETLIWKIPGSFHYKNTVTTYMRGMTIWRNFSDVVHTRQLILISLEHEPEQHLYTGTWTWTYQWLDFYNTALDHVLTAFEHLKTFEVTT